jgi:hypothetical protein
MSITVATALTDTWKQEVLQGYHLYLSSGGNTFKMSLLTATASGSGTYGTATTNAGTPGTGSPTTANIGTDETTDTSGNAQYTAGGFTMTTNANPTISSHVAYVTWSTNPNWGTAATITSCGAVLYNSSTTGGSAGRVVASFSFGGNQSSTLGTFTVTLPSATSTTALLRLA